MLEVILISAVKVIIVVVAVLPACAYPTLMERRVIAFMQNRIGPNTAGPWGLLTPLADGLKLIFKEDIVPANAERVAYALAPIIAFVPSMLVFAVVPFTSDFSLFGNEITGVLSDLNIAVVYIFAVTLLGIYGICLAGWSSGSKYSLLGGIRSSAQMISYELRLSVSLLLPTLCRCANW